MNESLIKKEKPTVKKYNNKSYLIYNRLSFHSYSDDKKFDSFSFKSKYLYLLNFYDLEKLIKMKPTNLSKTKEKENLYNTVSELYNKGLKIIVMNIMNYQMFQKTSSIKNSIV